MPKGTFFVMIALAAAAAGCGTGAASETPTTPPPTSPASTSSSTSASTTSTTSVYQSLGEEIAVSESLLGTVTWRRASSIPAEFVLSGDIPGPTHHWTYDWLDRYENAQELTDSCFEIYQESAGYLGLGPCPVEWVPWGRPEDARWETARVWGFAGAIYPRSAEWIWMREVWFSEDGESWEQTASAFPDPTAVVAAEPWSVAERNGRWIVIGATGVDQAADPGLIPWDERTHAEKYYGANWLVVPRGADPAAWVSDDLSEWTPVAADFSTDGMDTRLSSVVAGNPGWMIFGVRSSREPPRVTEWAAWTSADGITWEELSMAGVYDTPCKPSIHEHCGMIKAHVTDDAVIAYAVTWPLEETYPLTTAWRLLIGEL